MYICMPTYEGICQTAEYERVENLVRSDRLKVILGHCEVRRGGGR